MKMSTFRSLIREEITKVLKETPTKKYGKVLKENAMQDIEKLFLGANGEGGLLSNLVQAGTAKLPRTLAAEYDDATFTRGADEGDTVADFEEEMQFYVKYSKYFDPKVVKAAKMILAKM